MPATLDILESDEDGGKGGRILQGGIHRCLRRDSGISDILHNFKHGGGCGSAILGVSDGGGRGRSGWARTRGQTSKFPLLHERWHGRIVGPAMAPGRFQNLGRTVRQSGTADYCQEDSCHGLSPVPGGGDVVGGGVREKDDRRGTCVMGEAEGLDPVQVVWG